MIDYYEILEVSPHATRDVIKAAYHVLLARYDIDDYVHPKEIEQKVTTIKLAFDVLSDPEKRKDYDLHLNTFKHQSAAKDSERRKIERSDQDAKAFASFGRLKWNKWGWSVSILAVAAVLISMVQPDPERAERGQLAAQREAQKDRAKLEAEVMKQATGKQLPETANSRADSGVAANSSPVQTPSVGVVP